ncbi:MAG: GRAM domain-containing protein [Ginsengibacter sp.]
MDKKAKIKSGLIFGIAMTGFYIIQGLLTQDNLTTRNIIITIVSSLIGGVFTGFLFGWMMGLLANSKYLTKSIHIETGVNEAIVFETGANHFKGAEAVGGKLYLTNQRLVFKSHKLNIQNHELSIPLSDIENVDRYKALGISNNGLIVETINHTIEKFVVQKPGEWMEHLAEKNGSQNFAIQ